MVFEALDNQVVLLLIPHLLLPRCFSVQGKHGQHSKSCFHCDVDVNRDTHWRAAVEKKRPMGVERVLKRRRNTKRVTISQESKNFPEGNGISKKIISCQCSLVKTNHQAEYQTNMCIPFACPLHPMTAFILKLSKNPLRSSFLISTTQLSKLSILTLAFVSSTTSWKALPNLFRP